MAEWPDLMAVLDRAVVTSVAGNTGTYTPGSGPPVVVRGAFDEAYYRVDLGRAGGASSGPAVFLILSDLPSDPVTDMAATWTIGGRTYTISDPQPDGQGGVLCHLHRTT